MAVVGSLAATVGYVDCKLTQRADEHGHRKTSRARAPRLYGGLLATIF